MGFDVDRSGDMQKIPCAGWNGIGLFGAQLVSGLQKVMDPYSP
jgi:hypothetical protein